MSIFSFLSLGGNAQDNNKLKSLIQDTANTLLIDVRTPEEFASVHAQNSINIDSKTLPLQMSFFEKHKSKNFVIYCKSGMRSSNAVKALQKQGITNVYDAHTVDNVIAIQKQQ